MKRRTSVFWIIAIPVIATVVGTLLFLSRGSHRSPGIRLPNTRASLALARADIKKYRDSFGRYPPSLTEAVVALRGPSAKVWREYLSDARGCAIEHSALKGQGGWYYNETTGELRVNLKDPVRHFLSGDLGEWADQVPASW